jgi:outer membrane protein TolC
MASDRPFSRSKLGAALGAALVLSGAPASIGRAADPELSLSELARQAVAANLDLASRRRELAAARQEIGLARSPLLPQVDVGARGQILDDDRPDEVRGNNVDKSLLVGAGLSQVLYDENSWAGFQAQQHIYEGQVQELNAFQLMVVQDAASAFLELDRAQQVLRIEQQNRDLTKQNLETSRARIAAGYSSEREVLRWESQLASNDLNVRAAEVAVLQSRFELNRIRNVPPEEIATLREASIEEYGFVYASEEIAAAIAEPEQDRRMRDFLARLGLRHSPDLKALNASIAAAERQLTASRRAFWVPSLSLSAGVDHLTNNSSDEEFNATEWVAKGVLSFPLFQGGAKFAGLEQSGETVASLRTARSATALALDQSIRAALAQASGAFESVGFASRQLSTARRNFELVDPSYKLGVASILALLDAQQLLLTAELTLANARYGFLRDLIAAERALSFYAFLEPTEDVEAVIADLARELGLQP